MKVLLHLICIAFASAFCPQTHLVTRISNRHIKPRTSSFLHLTTEEDVIKLVEKAEQLWAQAYEARKSANDLSEKAETLGINAEQSASDAQAQLQSSVSVAKIGEAQLAQNLSLDLGNLLEKVQEAEKMADEIEGRAEEALKASEEALEQHLIDFPENA